MTVRTSKSHRTGSVYVAVLGTSLIVALLGMSALIGQRIQNRILLASADLRQAQLNAQAAVESALLIMKQEANWRTSYPNGDWIVNRDTGAGAFTLQVNDPIDSNLANSAEEPAVVVGIGYSGQAQQRVELTVDPRREPLGCLRSAVAVGDDIELQVDTLRTDGLITADQISATSSLVFGNVEAVAVTGSTYSGTTTLVTPDKRPTMPDWPTVFSYYRTIGTELNVFSLPATTPNLGRNVSFDSNTANWTGTAAGLPSASISREVNFNGHAACLRVHSRSSLTAGASQYIDHIVKPGVSYNITIEVAANSVFGNSFRVKLATKGSGPVQTSTSSPVVAAGAGWQTVNVTLPALSWSGPLEYARITVDTDHVLANSGTFYIDNLDIRESTVGRFIYRQLLSPSVNTLYGGAPTNPQGVYWINCQGNRLIIDRSRILGTLLVVNPGANSCVAEGPIIWAPAVAGYPALLVDADNASNANFSLRATNRSFSEADHEVNFNPPGAPFDFANLLCSATDSLANDIYSSEIRGLIAVRNDLTFQNNPLVRGQVIVGGDIINSSGELDVQYQPDSLLNPPPGFWGSYLYSRRPNSSRKTVLP